LTPQELLLGLLFVLTAGGMMIIFTLPRLNRKAKRHYFRPIPAFKLLQRAMGNAVEDGTRIHVSLGNSPFLSPTNASALAGLSALEKVTQSSLMSDRPPLATSGDATLSILSQETLRAAYRSGNIADQFDADRGELTGLTPFSYIAGTIPVIRNEAVSASLLIGSFGPEVALLTEASDQARATTIVATDSLPAQAVAFATSSEPVVGEEVFAIPAYLKSGPMHEASLRAQDILRWVLIIIMVGGAMLKFLGFV
jgi:hypothetical protein